ncbi:nucleotidyltransferase domain-containing protein [Candidatus Woesearchaeota archaeon]|nr:nucleotidyltransferase domain-containing protein [Candidatus Woesearchaeota archaeon]
MLQKSSMSKTLEVFFDNPMKEFYLMELSHFLGLAHTSIKKNLVQLTRLGFITEKIIKRGKRKFPVYKSNIENKNFKKYKIISNLSILSESGLIEYLEEKLFPKVIVLFGSYRKGEDMIDSDIDLFVECKKEELNLSLFEKKLKRKIQLHFKEDFNSFPKELKNNIINGIVLYGFLEGCK